MVAFYLLANGGWINIIILSFLGDASVGRMIKTVGRGLHFDFAVRDSFEEKGQLHWAERVRARAIRFFDKLARQKEYVELAEVRERAGGSGAESDRGWRGAVRTARAHASAWPRVPSCLYNAGVPSCGGVAAAAAWRRSHGTHG